MTSRLVRLASAAARLWVALYTARLPAGLRDDRRAEIAADLWQQIGDASAADAPAPLTAGHILLRTLLGVPDDLAWRLEALDTRPGVLFDARRLMMSVSPRQVRWLGLCAIAAGTLSAVLTLVSELLGNPGRVYTSDTAWHLEGPMAIIGPLVGIVLMLLLTAGIVGLYVANRREAGRAAKAGFAVLAAALVMNIIGFALSVVVPLEGIVEVVFNVLVVPPTVAMLPLGFLLLGIGLPRPVRRIPLVLGIYLTGRSVIALAAIALREPLLYRSDSLVGVASGLLFDVALAAVGYSVWSHLPRSTPELSNA